MKQICVGGEAIGHPGRPLICTSVTGKTRSSILGEMAAIVPKAPDLIEWRVDLFEGVGDIATVIDLATEIKAAAHAIPIVFAFRTINEGGGANALNEADILKLYVAACASRCVDIIDYEMSNASTNVAMLRQVSASNGVTMIMSYHNHETTPDREELMGQFSHAERLGADVAKVVVMPRSAADVVSLLEVTQTADSLGGIPVVAVAMGGVGALSRVFGWMFGSTVTFAAGKSRPAPGQMSIKELRSVLNSVCNAVQGG